MLLVHRNNRHGGHPCFRWPSWPQALVKLPVQRGDIPEGGAAAAVDGPLDTTENGPHDPLEQVPADGSAGHQPGQHVQDVPDGFARGLDVATGLAGGVLALAFLESLLERGGQEEDQGAGRQVGVGLFVGRHVVQHRGDLFLELGRKEKN